MEIRRGDIVIAAFSGDYGKPRPAVVVQSDLFNPTHASVTVCPITSKLIGAPLFRLPLEPSPANGLMRRSQIMIDKAVTLRRERVSKVAGRLSERETALVDKALRAWLEL